MRPTICRLQGFAGADDIVHDEHTAAGQQLRLAVAEVERLHILGRNGLYLNRDGVGHIDLKALARHDIFVDASLPRHFVREGDALGLRRDEDVMFRGDL